MGKFYIGTITEVIDVTGHIVKVDVPGLYRGLTSYPDTGLKSDPMVGDPVVIHLMDTEYQSYSVYKVLKESDFIGVKSLGKMIEFTPDKITVGVYSDEEYKEPEALLEILNSGEINIMSANSINITGDTVVTGGKLEVDGVVTKGNTGPFNCIGICPFTGLPHAGKVVEGT